MTMIMSKPGKCRLICLLLALSCLAVPAQPPRHQTRLILKDGSYQTVTEYTVKGGVVHYRSAERNNAEEEIPAKLVDWDATHAWEQAHANGSTAVLDPDLAAEEADIAARTPEVAPNLHLPDMGSVLALDVYDDGNELVNLPQSDSDLNKNTAHKLGKLIKSNTCTDEHSYNWPQYTTQGVKKLISGRCRHD